MFVSRWQESTPISLNPLGTTTSWTCSPCLPTPWWLSSCKLLRISMSTWRSWAIFYHPLVVVFNLVGVWAHWNYINMLVIILILSRGVQQIRGSSGSSLKMFKHMKIYDGLLESSFMFVIQLVVVFVRPPVGPFMGWQPNGKCELKLTLSDNWYLSNYVEISGWQGGWVAEF